MDSVSSASLSINRFPLWTGEVLVSILALPSTGLPEYEVR
ncbi:hypothetical protein GA0070604_4135 [Micromonospora eburnea]|uniref:Uncharacterized protein n=1 Tax=Micromonospora eburnea TaxID=227316 RepID=A0A1C6V0H4_9ACTN|nr:hypothetical protein GA0070604_4135 [Micromonospora eburnea]